MQSRSRKDGDGMPCYPRIRVEVKVVQAKARCCDVHAKQKSGAEVEKIALPVVLLLITHARRPDLDRSRYY